MATATVEKEVFWRGSFDEYAVVNVQKVTRITDEGVSMERIWAASITPDDDVTKLATQLGVTAGVATALRAIVETVRIPASIARYNARKSAIPPVVPLP